MQKQNKNNLLKIIATGIGLFLVGLGILKASGNNTDILGFFVEKVYAAPEIQSQTTSQTVDNRYSTVGIVLENLLKVLYITLWPALVIAGKAMDNQLIYGGVFHLDVSLRQFRNMMKNIANFGLAFFIVYEILRSYFSSKAVKFGELIKNALLAGVLIQFSRFIVGAILDIATIATVSLGGLPLSILDETAMGKKPVIGSVSTLELSNLGKISEGKQSVEHYSVFGNTNILPCFMENNKLGGPKKLSEKIGGSYKDIKFSTDYCMMGSKALYIGGIKEDFLTIEPIKYKDKISELNIEAEKKLVEDPNNKGGLTLSTLLEGSRSFVGPFYTLYSSLLNFGSLNITDNVNDITSYGMEFFIKSIVSLALMIPLLAIAAAMVVRIGVMWLVIAFSPIIALFWGFGWNLTSLGGKNSSIESIVGLIFMPVVAVFSLSLSIIFLTALQDSTLSTFNGKGGTQSAFEEALGVTYKNTDTEYCFSLNGLDHTTCLEIGKQGNNSNNGFSIFLDFFARLITNLFAIGLVRICIFAALGTSKITAYIGDSLKNMTESLLGNLPIIPTPLGRISGAGLQKLGTEIPTQITQSRSDASNKTVEQLLAGTSGGSESSNLKPEKVEEAIEKIGKTSNISSGAAGLTQGLNQELGTKYTNNSEFFGNSAGTEGLFYSQSNGQSLLGKGVDLLSKSFSSWTKDEKDQFYKGFNDFLEAKYKNKGSITEDEFKTLETEMSLEGGKGINTKNKELIGGLRVGDNYLQIKDGKIDKKPIFTNKKISNRTPINNITDQTEKDNLDKDTQFIIDLGPTGLNFSEEFLSRLKPEQKNAVSIAQLSNLKPEQKAALISTNPDGNEFTLDDNFIETITAKDLPKLSPAQITNIPTPQFKKLLTDKPDLINNFSGIQLLAMNQQQKDILKKRTGNLDNTDAIIKKAKIDLIDAKVISVTSL